MLARYYADSSEIEIGNKWHAEFSFDILTKKLAKNDFIIAIQIILNQTRSNGAFKVIIDFFLHALPGGKNSCSCAENAERSANHNIGVIFYFFRLLDTF